MTTSTMPAPGPVAVTGATGYVGGRLVPLLLEQGFTVRAMGRSLTKMRCRTWATHPNVELVEADMHKPQSVANALQGCDAAYYLVHSMYGRHKDFARADREAATNMVQAADAAGVSRIIYLGGMIPAAEPGSDISHHLQSRAEVADILGSGAAALTSLHAAQILGSGSASFELLRYLVDRLPVMVTPKWVTTQAQPIAISNVLGYLAGCLHHPETAGQSYDIGGPDILSYRELFAIYAQEAGLRHRYLIPVPVLTPRLSSYWVHLVTPVPAPLARPLIEGLSNRVVAKDTRIRDIIPQRLLSPRQAIRRALTKLEQQSVDSCWTDAGLAPPPEWLGCGDAHYGGGTILTCGYEVTLSTTPSHVWPLVAHIGGDTGWYYGDMLWKLRGWMDTLLGGVGMRRGRRHPLQIRIGDTLDFWRVVDVQENKRLLLLAEMKVPGEALLEFTLTPQSGHQTRLTQTARFLPKGLWGMAYWYAMAPFHALIFGNMLRSIALHSGKRIIDGPHPVGTEPGRPCAL